MHARRVAVALLSLAAPIAGAASFPPGLRFRTLDSGNVVVHFHQGLEPLAREAAALAAEILASHAARYHTSLPRVHIVIDDADDDPNGFALPLPYPLVRIHAAAPSGADEFGNYESWLRLVLTHELAHIVDLDEAHGLVRAGRKLFGRAPFLFPNALTPTWMIEGLATYEETRGTAFGRGRNPDSRMIVRMAALADAMPGEDVAAVYADTWPQGQTPYLFGERFLEDLTERFGDDTLPELARVHSGRIIPFVDELTSSRVTGAPFHRRWAEWCEREREAATAAAEAIRARGLSASRAITTRGIHQDGPRFSPDGAWIAYTSRTLARFGQLRLVRADGSGDRKLANRTGGASLGWSPDGSSIVFDEPEVHDLFATRSDLRVVEVSTGRVHKLTHGLRASDPDVAPDGRTIVFVRRLADRSELSTLDRDSKQLRTLTQSLPGTQWSGPRWSPSGDRIAVSRWTTGGWLDVVVVDPATGAVTNLTLDRARDADATWTPDGGRIVFRSDRDGVSNLYALDLGSGALLRLSNVLGGAFAPSVSPDGASVAFASYDSRGYDVNVTTPDWASLAVADAFVDSFPQPRQAPEAVSVASRPYRPLPAMLPRFWSPYAASVSGEWRYGLVTGGADPLFRHAYAVDVHRGSETGRLSGQAFYQYDRFRPTFSLSVEDTSDLKTGGFVERTRQARAEASFPLTRSFRRSQSVDLAWRRESQTLNDAPDHRLDLGGVEVAWAISSVRQYPWSISPVEGWRLRLAYLQEDPALGSDVSLGKGAADLRAFLRLGDSGALAFRTGGGTTFGTPRFRRSYAVGGFPDGNLFDVVRTNFSVLRGYPDDAFTGRSFAHANLECRLPLGHPERGLRSLPFFLRHLHAAFFADAASAWSGRFRFSDVKTGAGAALGADMILGHALPLTGTLGVARGFGQQGETRVYVRAGLAF
jgi:Tol biopolymer transport system component